MLKQLNEILQKEWKRAGFTDPTEIQTRLYPLIKEGKSLVGISPTGSGKTLAYLLPLLETLEAGVGLQALILAPSQELVKQIGDQAKHWASLLGLKSQTIIGGANIQRQVDRLKANPEVIVASPGRFLELLNKSRRIKVHKVQTLILDEADYLLEGDQAQDVRKIASKLNKEYQKIWISATMAPALEKVIEAKQNQVLRVEVGDVVLSNLIHQAILVQNRQKHITLRKLSQVEGMQALVFFDRTIDLDHLSYKLKYDGVKHAVLHSKLGKMEREKSIREFKQGKVTYLLTTDIAARGLDIENLPCVIHYQRVEDSRTYFHRSGRTGRMGKEGLVLSLVNEQEFRDLQVILNPYHIQIDPVKVHGARLVKPDFVESLKEDKQEERKTKELKKKKVVREEAQPKPPKMAKKKKNRHRDRVNKGKPKNKKAKGELQ